jgi:hypothetical protein
VAQLLLVPRPTAWRGQRIGSGTAFYLLLLLPSLLLLLLRQLRRLRLAQYLGKLQRFSRVIWLFLAEPERRARGSGRCWRGGS